MEKRLGTSSTRETLEKIQSRRTSTEGIFGIKVHYSHLAQVGGFTELHRSLPDPHSILLRRNDPLEQAISWSIAAQTGAWISGMPAAAKTPRYNHACILERLKRVTQESAAWSYLLATHGCRCLELEFAEVRDNLSASHRRIADFVGAEPCATLMPAEAPTRRQRTGLGAE